MKIVHPSNEIEEEIVISGIAGRYPDSSSIQEFWDNLCNGSELSTIDDQRWAVGLMNLPERTGKVPDVEKFDAEFFGMSDNHANWSDPSIRLVHETTFEAIVDAGITPNALKGPRTGVFMGWCYSDASAAFKEDEQKAPGFMQNFSTRLSTSFGFKGIALGIDTACASSFSALNQAVLSIRSGECDSAIVGGVAIHLSPNTAFSFARLGMTSKDGRSKCMDASADGYGRSEAIVSIVLQKMSVARRSYASIIHSKTNTDGYKVDGITFPSVAAQRNLMKEVYTECGIDPGSVDYIEAHMTGTSAGDPVESEAIASVLCSPSRKGPLPVGCLKSNMGHAEGASGLCAITKACLIFQRKKIPPNLHLKNKNPLIKPLMQGILRPITALEPFDGSLIALNCFGFGGCNVHVLLKAAQEKEQGNDIVGKNLDRLVLVAGRTKEGLDAMASHIKNNPKDITQEYLSLLEGVANIDPQGFGHRCWMILDKDKRVKQRRDNRTLERKPLWLFFSGLNSFLNNSKSAVASLQVLKKIAEDCAFLSEKMKEYMGLLSEECNLKEGIFHKRDASIHETIVRDAVSYMLWVDLIKELGVHVDGVIGCSAGEVIALYADASLTSRQALRIINALGSVLEKEQHAKSLDLINCTDIDETVVSKFLPEGFDIISLNTSTSFTIAVDEARVSSSIKEMFVKNVERKGGKVNSMQKLCFPLHSPAMASLENQLEKSLIPILKDIKLPDRKILSTSVDQTNWYSTSKLDASYFAKILSNQINLSQVLDFIPKDAVMIEIGCDDQYSLSRSLIRGVGPDASYHSLACESCNDFLENLGEIYLRGINPMIDKLYPRVSFPVSKSTASISHLIKWNHSKDYIVTKHPDYFNYMTGNRPYSVDILDRKFKFLTGHCLDGRNLFPATGYLWLIWITFAQLNSGNKREEEFMELAIQFENVSFSRATILPKQGGVTFNIQAVLSTGQFAIIEGGSVCVSGFARICTDNPSTKELEKQVLLKETDSEVITLTQSEVYKELRVRGYDYGPTFHGLQEARSDGSVGKIKWLGNWISFTDSLLQLGILAKKERSLFLPTFIDYMKCDIKTLLNNIESNKNETGDSILTAKYDIDLNTLCTNGLVIKGMKASPAQRRSTQMATVESYAFTPYNESYLSHPVKEKKRIDTYKQYCHQMLKVIETNNQNGLKESIDGDENLKILLEPNDGRNILAKTLWEVIHSKTDVAEKELKTVLPESLSSVENKLSGDTILSSSLTMEKLLRTQLDVFIENFPGKKMNIMEVNQSDFLLHKPICEALESNMLVINNYNLLHPNPDEITKSHHGLDASALKNLYPTDLEADLLVINDASNKFATGIDFRKVDLEKTAEAFDFGSFFKSAVATLRDKTFVLILFRSLLTPIEEYICQVTNVKVPEERLTTVKQLTIAAEEVGLTVIAVKSTIEGFHSMLLRKSIETLSQETNHVTIDVKIDDYSWVNDLKEHFLDKEGATKDEKKSYKVWLLAQDSPSNGIVGLINCLKREVGGDRIRCIFRPPKERPEGLEDSELITSDVIAKDLIMNVYRGGELGSFRHLSVESMETFAASKDAFLDVKTKGDLSSLRWMEGEHKFWTELPETAKNNGDLLCSLYYSALNFKDIMVATGRVPVDAYPQGYFGTGLIGMEFSGKDQNGNRIFAFCASKAIATTLLLRKIEPFVWKIPEHWTMAEAATVPVVYVTVYYALFIRGRLRPGESVLIHAGSGGVGQAAISVCLAKGCPVFTTVGSQAKRDFLLKEFPQLKASHIGNSRDTSFEEMVLKETNGRGVDLVLNSLSDDKLQAGLRCLADFGRFIEIGKYDIIQNNAVNLSDLGRNKTLHIVCVAHLDFDALVTRSPAAMKLVQELHKAVDDGIANGEIRPLKYHVFDKDQTEEAFRFMATGKHMGKVLIKMRDDDDLTSVAPELYVKALKQSFFNPFDSFIVTGGLGGFGLEVASWMIFKGVKKIVLSSRSGVKTSFQKLAIQRFRDQEVEVIVSNNDCSSFEGAKALIEEAKTMGPVKGIFHLAMVLKDAGLENQTVESFSEACASKVQGTLHLDKLTRESCPDLEYFVCFSSVVSGRGNIGQTNYGFANSVMERVCEMRKKDGFPGLAIQWGAVGDVGVVAELIGGNAVVIAGCLPQRLPSCLDVLSKFLTSPEAVYSSLVSADKKKYGSDGKEDLLKIVCHVLGVKDASILDSDTTLGDLGMDSLMVVEIRQALEREFDMVLSAQEVRSLKIRDIEQLGASRKSKSLQGMSSGSASRKSKSKAVINLPFSLNIPQDMFVTLNVGEGKPIFFFGPVVESGFNSLTNFASNVQRPVLGVNWTKELNSLESLEAVASLIVEKLNEDYLENAYDIAGYSFGGLIALLVAKELKDKIKKLVLIDAPGRIVESTHSPSLGIFSSWILNRKVGDKEIQSLETLSQVLSTEQNVKVDLGVLDIAFDRYKKKCQLVSGFKSQGSLDCESLSIRSSFEVKSDSQEFKKLIPNCKVKKFDGCSSFDVLSVNSEAVGSAMDIFFELLSVA